MRCSATKTKKQARQAAVLGQVARQRTCARSPAAIEPSVGRWPKNVGEDGPDFAGVELRVAALLAG